MTYPDPPPDPPLVYGPDPVPPPPRRPIGRFDLIGATACVAVLIGLGVGVLVGSDGDDKPTPKTTHSTSAPATTDNEPVVEEEPTSEYDDITASDFLIELKTTAKKCYGYGVGCNVTVEPELSYMWDLEDLDPAATYSITYEITGDENGPVTETLELTNQEDVNFTPTHLSTSGSGVDIEVEITDVESY